MLLGVRSSTTVVGVQPTRPLIPNAHTPARSNRPAIRPVLSAIFISISVEPVKAGDYYPLPARAKRQAARAATCNPVSTALIRRVPVDLTNLLPIPVGVTAVVRKVRPEAQEALRHQWPLSVKRSALKTTAYLWLNA